MGKVKYLLGNNEGFDYYILARKQEIQIENKSLSLALDPEPTAFVLKFSGNIYGNFDLLLEKRRKITDEFCGYELVNYAEIENFEL